MSMDMQRTMRCQSHQKQPDKGDTSKRGAGRRD